MSGSCTTTPIPRRRPPPFCVAFRPAGSASWPCTPRTTACSAMRRRTPTPSSSYSDPRSTALRSSPSIPRLWVPRLGRPPTGRLSGHVPSIPCEDLRDPHVTGLAVRHTDAHPLKLGSQHVQPVRRAFPKRAMRLRERGGVRHVLTRHANIEPGCGEARVGIAIANVVREDLGSTHAQGVPEGHLVEPTVARQRELSGARACHGEHSSECPRVVA